MNIGEYEHIGRVVEIACFLRKRGQLGALALDHLGEGIDDAREALDKGYRGGYQCLADYFEELTEETVVIPELLRPYVDYEAMARDAS